MTTKRLEDGPADTASAGTKPVVTPAAAQATDPIPGPSPAAIVDSLYRIHDNGRGPVLTQESGKVHDRFFDSTLAALFMQNLIGPPNGEVSNLDFDPFYNAQEMGIKNFAIGDATITGDSAVVVVTFDNFDRKERLAYQLRGKPQGWKIRNIVYGDGDDLLTTLRKPW